LGNGTAINFGGGTLQYESGNSADISARTVTINSGGATIDTAGNNVTFTKRIGNGGAGSLVKTGAGTLTLNTNSTFSGVTFINQGTLLLGTSLSNSAALVVGAGATLDASTTGYGLNLNGAIAQVLAGSGTVTGVVTTASGTTLTAGTNGVAGTLTFGNDLNLNGGTYVFDVGTASRDLLSVAGALSVNGGTLAINPLNTLTNGTYKLIQYAGGYGGSVNNLTLSGGQANKIFALSDATSG
jgi:fibronectin-binding autotransporter adhesin